MALQIKCPGCGKVLKVPDAAAGKAVRCPSCQAAVKVPAAREAREAPAAPPAPPAGVPARSGGVLLWTEPKNVVNTLFGLTDECVFAADLKKGLLQEAAARIEEGAGPGKVLGRRGTVVPLEAVRSAEMAETSATLDVFYGKGPKPGRLRIYTLDDRKRATLFEALGERGGFESREEQVSALAAVKVPAILTALAALFTFLFFMAARQAVERPESVGRGRHAAKQKLFAGLVEAIGPGGVLVIGLLAVAACLVWVFLRCRNRPRKQILSPASRR